jgi:hypothetical protein
VRFGGEDGIKRQERRCGGGAGPDQTTTAGGRGTISEMPDLRWDRGTVARAFSQDKPCLAPLRDDSEEGKA